MKVYKVRKSKLAGTSYREVYNKAFLIYKGIKSKTKRTPYVRAAYFNGGKIFLTLFWGHIQQKSWNDRARRLRYLACAIELMAKSKYPPVSKQNPNKPQEILHRFAGLTTENELFYVQIKENKSNDKKWLMSIFPDKG